MQLEHGLSLVSLCGFHAEYRDAIRQSDQIASATFYKQIAKRHQVVHKSKLYRSKI